MLKFFGTGNLSRYFAIFFMLLLFWIPAYFNPLQYGLSVDSLFSLLYQFIGANIYITLSVALLFTIYSSLLVNQLATDFEFSTRYSSLGIFFFVLISSSLLSSFSFNPIVLINIFILFFLKNIFSFPSSNTPITLAFNAGLLLGFASLFFAPLLLLLFFLWGAIIIHRLTDWRNFAASLIGILLPYLFLFTAYLWTETVVENAGILMNTYIFIPELKLPDYSLNLMISIFIFIVLILSSLNVLGRLREKNIKLRRNLMITLLYFVFTTLISWYYFKITETMLLITIPAALILTSSVNPGKKMKLFNLTIYTLFFLIILNLYLNFGKYLLDFI